MHADDESPGEWEWDGDCRRCHTTISIEEGHEAPEREEDALCNACVWVELEEERAAHAHTKDVLRTLRTAARDHLRALGEYVRQTLHSNPEWMGGIAVLESASETAEKIVPTPPPPTHDVDVLQRKLRLALGALRWALQYVVGGRPPSASTQHQWRRAHELLVSNRFGDDLLAKEWREYVEGQKP